MEEYVALTPDDLALILEEAFEKGLNARKRCKCAKKKEESEINPVKALDFEGEKVNLRQTVVKRGGKNSGNK